MYPSQAIAAGWFIGIIFLRDPDRPDHESFVRLLSSILGLISVAVAIACILNVFCCGGKLCNIITCVVIGVCGWSVFGLVYNLNTMISILIDRGIKRASEEAAKEYDPTNIKQEMGHNAAKFVTQMDPTVISKLVVIGGYTIVAIYFLPCITLAIKIFL